MDSMTAHPADVWRGMPKLSVCSAPRLWSTISCGGGYPCPTISEASYDRCLVLLKNIAAGKLALLDEGGDDGADEGDADPGGIAVVIKPLRNGLG